MLAVAPSELNPLDVAEWFLTPTPELEVKIGKKKDGLGILSPRDWLLGGYPPGRVARLFKHL